MRLKVKKIWLPGFFCHITLLLLGMSLFTLYFYFVGNAQGFSNQSLIILFGVESWLLSLTATTGVISTLACFIMLPFSKKFQINTILLATLATAFSLALYLGVALLEAFLNGYGGGF